MTTHSTNTIFVDFDIPNALPSGPMMVSGIPNIPCTTHFFAGHWRGRFVIEGTSVANQAQIDESDWLPLQEGDVEGPSILPTYERVQFFRLNKAYDEDTDQEVPLEGLCRWTACGERLDTPSTRELVQGKVFAKPASVEEQANLSPSHAQLADAALDSRAQFESRHNEPGAVETAEEHHDVAERAVAPQPRIQPGSRFEPVEPQPAAQIQQVRTGATFEHLPKVNKIETPPAQFSGFPFALCWHGMKVRDMSAWMVPLEDVLKAYDSERLTKLGIWNPVIAENFKHNALQWVIVIVHLAHSAAAHPHTLSSSIPRVTLVVTPSQPAAGITETTDASLTEKVERYLDDLTVALAVEWVVTPCIAKMVTKESGELVGSTAGMLMNKGRSVTVHQAAKTTFCRNCGADNTGLTVCAKCGIVAA